MTGEDLPHGFEDLTGAMLEDRWVLDDLVSTSPRRAAFNGHERDGGHMVVVTVVRPLKPHDQATLERFEQRVFASRRVQHRAVVVPTDFGERFDGKLWLVTDRPRGDPLERHLRAHPLGRLAWVDARLLLLELVQGIAAAHARKVVHGALCPGCCWVDRRDLAAPSLRVLDFGANTSPALSDRDVVGSRTTVVGHDAVYMAPETAGGQLGDMRSDIYVAGLLAWLMLVGRAPFQGTNPFQLTMMHMNVPVPAMRDYGADVPVKVEALVRRLLAKDPAERPTMAEVEAAVRGLDERGQPVAAHSADPVMARGRKGRAQARQAKASAGMGVEPAGMVSRDELAQRRASGEILEPEGGPRLQWQELLDVRRPSEPPHASTPAVLHAEADMHATHMPSMSSTPATVPPFAPTLAETLSQGTLGELQREARGDLAATMVLSPKPATVSMPPMATVPLTREQVRALRNGVGALAPGAPPPLVTSRSEPTPGLPPAITGQTQQMTPEDLRALRRGMAAPAPTSHPTPYAPIRAERVEERTMHLPVVSDDPRPHVPDPASEHTSYISPEELAVIRRSHAKRPGEPDRK